VNQNESNAALRTIPLFLVDSFGNGVSGLAFSAGEVKLKKHGGSWTNVSALPAEDTGGGGAAGTYLLTLSQAETDTIGELRVQVIKTSVRTFSDYVIVALDPSAAFLATVLLTGGLGSVTVGGALKIAVAQASGDGLNPSGDGNYSYKDPDGTTRVSGTLTTGVRAVAVRVGT